MQNQHTGHGDHFPNCLHAEIEQRQNRKWLIPGTIACNKVLAIVNNPRLCKDIAMMSEKHQTSRLEAFHSLLNQFAPKTYHFLYRPQKCRTLLAVLHYNENGGRSQASTVDGASRYALTFPKFKKGGAVVRPVMVAASYEYVDKLLDLVVTRCNEGVIQPSQVDIPSFLCSSFERPDKAEAIAAHRTRFLK
ncbi:uncharacterized protein LOC117106580 [Anneissia japonica]|uniref:uncharacterized protein LOC117106580 n=1 Tax=Anneissia japonica TaxID=1529436 RepID=UPI001425B2CD|nr:uncharacterized protein LOC117106580 [Anneissia japonica]